jgi:hypothetical protein
MADEFKFPDEVEDKKVEDTEVAAPEVEVEIVDDTPPQDRNRVPAPKELVQQLENDDLEDYSEKVKKRFVELKRVWHDERREKESALREKEEYLRYAKLKDEENRQLKQRLGAGETLLKEEVTRSAGTEVAAAKAMLKRAYESGDAEQIADAQEALTDAKIKLKDFQRFQPTTLQESESSVETVQQPTYQAQVDPKADAWRKANTWFGTDDEMTSLALGLHQKLVRSGVDPRSDEYYQRINVTMRKRFPENFPESEIESSDQQPMQQESKPAQRKAAPVVASVTRSTAPRKVSLSATQAAIAKRLNLTPEAYAKEMLKLEAQNG